MSRLREHELARLVSARDVSLAREDFFSYCRRTIPRFKPTPFHRELCSALQDAVEGVHRRTLIEAPVRHGKTMLAAERLPLWAMSRTPGLPAMLCSYGGELASRSGRRLRNLALDARHLEVFPDAGLTTDSQRADAFTLVNGSSFMAAGTNGPIMGSGWKLGILDDLLKGREAADSETQRNAVWDWYASDFLSRQEYPNSLVFITARWSLDDPAARIRVLAESGAEDWRIISYSALDEHDNALAEDLVPAHELKRLRKVLSAAGDTRSWQALYQCQPVADEGLHFRREWFKESSRRWTPEDATKGLVRVYAASDYAASEAGDWTVHLVFGVDPSDNLQILDLWRGRTTPDVWVDAMLDLGVKWRPLMWAEEKGGLANAVGPMIAKRMMERRVYFARRGFPSVKDKATRAQTVIGRMAMGMVYFPKAAPWYPALEAECLAFDAGKHDDIVDCLSLAGRLVHGMARGQHPAPPQEDISVIEATDTGNPLAPVSYQYPVTIDQIWTETVRRRRGRRAA